MKQLKLAALKTVGSVFHTNIAETVLLIERNEYVTMHHHIDQNVLVISG